ncbi:MAG TPA: hypothetical protein VKM55_15615 [Candidatus Lokiarchaeia archaeon]|nr:hypothetical protein [Candidatus Lokiarchaeia archaeon]
MTTGRTVLSYRQALNREVASWNEFRRGLSPDDQACFDDIATMARQHADASSLAARPMMSENVFMSVLVALTRHVHELEEHVKQLEKAVNE